MGRFVVVVLDSFGIGAMADVEAVRPQDIGANTCKHIIKAVPDLHLPNLAQLGLMNALGEEVGAMGYSADAVFGTADLMHMGADSFYGHQELMGTRPQQPLLQPFAEVIERVYAALSKAGYAVRYAGDKARILIVNDSVAVGDNLETDPGQVYNVSGCLDVVPFEDVVAIGQVVRSVVQVARVIALGGEAVSFEQLMEAHVAKLDGVHAGIDTPKSGLYARGYRVIHLGYGVDASVQIPNILGREGIEVSLIGKVGDIVDNRYGSIFPGVETAYLFIRLLDEVERIQHGFICLNIQETDLAGHAQHTQGYADCLRVCDAYIGELMERMKDDDILIVTADHGNDPTIGHSQHTREQVPVLAYRQGVRGIKLGHMPTLSDIGATVADYFSAEPPENGQSFLSKLKKLKSVSS
ncbi:phosphopentomutase [Paenibacillus sp. HWE-109]|uniref:phosphopentomutase n=1 Tax=Paenibacillus sp. HWE-109 TaxID=1306526 RepID=UPI001EDC9B51|nr:phosphopentomutase [Paenibacillus sp. HWE-109]UKS24817.1 phosphopentomutase [Paenibacillus sp. HWE-109]